MFRNLKTFTKRFVVREPIYYNLIYFPGVYKENLGVKLKIRIRFRGREYNGYIFEIR